MYVRHSDARVGRRLFRNLLYVWQDKSTATFDFFLIILDLLYMFKEN